MRLKKLLGICIQMKQGQMVFKIFLLENFPHYSSRGYNYNHIYLQTCQYAKLLEEDFITLILKKNSSAKVNIYKYISLCNIIYKMVANITVNWLKPILLSLVLVEQGAFVLG